MLALSLLSFTNSVVWLSWTQFIPDAHQHIPYLDINVSLASFVGSWFTISVIGLLLLLRALTRRARWVAFMVVGASMLAQLPGIVSHTKFQWLWLAAGDQAFGGQPGIAVVGLALMATPVGIYSLGAAAAFESLTQVFIQGNADKTGVLEAQRSNFILLAAVMGASLAIGSISIGAWAGIPGDISGLFRNFGPALVWTSVVASIVAMAFGYSYLYSKWPSSARLDARSAEGPQPGEQPT